MLAVNKTLNRFSIDTISLFVIILCVKKKKIDLKFVEMLKRYLNAVAILGSSLRHLIIFYNERKKEEKNE